MTERRGWHFEKTISAGNLLTAVVIAVSVITWATTMDKRLALVEQQQKTDTESNVKTNDRQDKAMASDIAAIRENMRDISAKLDRVIEQRAAR